MGINIPAPSAGAGAPNVDAGLKPAIFKDLTLNEHPDWATESDKFGKPDNGQRYHFIFAILDKPGGKPLYEDGDPVILDIKTRTATGPRSGFRAVLEGILTAAELAAWEVGGAIDAEAIQDREVTLNVTRKTPDAWPQIEDVLPKMGK